MATPPLPDIPDALGATAAAAQPAAPERWMTELGQLLLELERAAGHDESVPPPAGPASDQQLVQRRLGIASSLFMALQCKHAATAGHSLRVALTCSAWTRQMGVADEARELLEIAALLHDIGIIAVPDQVLLKPGRLDGDEAALVSRSRAAGLEILRRSAPAAVLRIVEDVPAWYDGSRPARRTSVPACPMPTADDGSGASEDAYPTASEDAYQTGLAARMIAVAEAFDAMTTDRVYRPAMPQERAMAELFQCAGTQFDPEIVQEFAAFLEGDRESLRHDVATRWLYRLDTNLADSYWQLNCVPSPAAGLPVDGIFQAKLLDNMYDAVVFVDTGGRVVLWNHGAERLTGISGTSACGQEWQPELLNMADEKGRPIAAADCPVLVAIKSGAQSLRRLVIWGRSGRNVSVDAHAVPVIAADGTTQGAILLLHDASSEISLEQRCQSLHEKATRDPLTQLANRAEFDRVHAMFVAAHQQQQVPCSLLICDLDHFKQVNDTYGHQAGDEAIKSVSALLKAACRSGDLVARYGGEEFVMLCADCDNAAAARRAEQIRKSLAQMPQPKMGGRAVTISIGVTEIQPGDTAETMLRRADRALLMAKAKGRNTVVQLGGGTQGDEPAEQKRGFWSFAGPRPALLLEQNLITPVPVQMAIEKLRGFVADHQATILAIDGSQVRLEFAEKCRGGIRRFTDRPVTFQLELRFEEERLQKEQATGQKPDGGVTRTRIRVVISPRKDRDRRRSDVAERAGQVLISLRSYLMASHEEDEPPQHGTLTKAKHVLVPWLAKR